MTGFVRGAEYRLFTMKKGLILLPLCFLACEPATPIPPNPTVYFIEPIEGAHVITPFRVKLGVDDIVLERPGDVRPNHGHLVVQIGACSRPGEVVPHDEKHVHLEGAQTEVTLKLGYGWHVLCAQLADGRHVAQAPADVIEVFAEPY